jgi:hypothetical protein
LLKEKNLNMKKPQTKTNKNKKIDEEKTNKKSKQTNNQKR